MAKQKQHRISFAEALFVIAGILSVAGLVAIALFGDLGGFHSKF